MNNIKDITTTNSKHFVPSDRPNLINQIDSIGPLLAEVYKIVKEMKKQNEEILHRIRREN